jgi:hypothetical protein
MYYPYFRGKQNELITLRENAHLLKESNFIPIIEPVKESLKGLKRVVEEFKKAGTQFIVILNPRHGDHVEDDADLQEFFSENLENSCLFIGFILDATTTIEKIDEVCTKYLGKGIVFIHYGYSDAKELVNLIAKYQVYVEHVFIDEFSGRLYRKHFNDKKQILIRDGFQKRRKNLDHPEVELFSDLHITFKDEGMIGFGDFLIVGDDYSETGGPAYTVAIHITFIDSEKDDAMYVYHFKSDTNDTPTDPSGKFEEALNKLIKKLGETSHKIYETNAIKEYRDLAQKGHYPGLGYVKKLSMQHHIETLSEYFKNHGK